MRQREAAGYWTAAMVTAAIGLTVAAIALFARALRDESRRSFREQQVALNRFVTFSLRLALDAGKVDEARRLFDELARREVFAGAQLLDGQRGRLLATPGTFTIEPELLASVLERGPQTIGEVVYSSEELIDDEGDRLGWFVLALTDEPLQASEARAFWSVVAAAVPALALLLGLLAHQVGRGHRAQRRAAAAEEETNRAKSEFLANMSHELRTPMTAVLGYAELIEEEGTSPEERSAAIGAVRRNGHYLLELITNVLDLSKIEAGRMDIEHIETELDVLLHDVLEMLRHRARQRGIGLRASVLKPFPRRIHCDPTRLRQILINLLGNAVKFTERGRVTLEVDFDRTDSGHELALSIVDTGIGIPADRLGTLFEPFRQADSSTTRRFGGSGLGLAISRRLAERMGARLDVESAAGVGSRFTLRLPVSAPTDLTTELVARTATAIVETPATTSLRGFRLLVAEDGLDNQVLVKRLLQRLGAEVVLVDNGQAAVDAALQGPAGGGAFDLVVMDVQMPVLDGLEATRRLRGAGFMKPIVALTANALEGDRQRCLQAGCDDYATKPIRRAELERALLRLLPQPAAR